MTREQIKLLNLYSQYKYGVNFSEIVNFGMWGNIKSTAQTAGRTVGNSLYAVKHGVQDSFRGAKQVAGDTLSGIKTGFKGTKNTINTVTTGAKDYKNNLRNNTQYRQQAIRGTVNQLANNPNAVQNTANRFKNVVQHTGEQMKKDHVEQRIEHGIKDMNKGKQMMRNSFKNIASNNFKADYQNARQQINKGYGQVRSGFQKTGENLGAGVRRGLQTVGGTVNRMFRGNKNLYWYY